MQIGYGRAHRSAAYGAYYGPCVAGAYAPVYPPVVYIPVAIYWDDGGYPMHVPHDVEVEPANSPQTVIIGGTRGVSLTLEYLVETGAPSPTVKMTVSFEGASETWSEANIAPGYHVKEAVMSVKPGTKATVEVTDAMARLRWCETIGCWPSHQGGGS